MKAFELSTLLKLGIPYIVFFFAPITAAIIGLAVLIFFDVITGCRAAQLRGEEIRSNRLARTVSKIIFYSIAIILSRVMEVFFMDWMPVAKLTAGYIAVVEFKSNMENIASITGVDIWKHLMSKIEGWSKRV
jgi:ABC-type Co2+ transport system permease subunit